LVAAYLVAVVATPAGISGAVLLLPFRVSVLATPSPAVTPTNLLYNVVATPGALYRYWRTRAAAAAPRCAPRTGPGGATSPFPSPRCAGPVCPTPIDRNRFPMHPGEWRLRGMIDRVGSPDEIYAQEVRRGLP
jgi:hypothetical protein